MTNKTPLSTPIPLQVQRPGLDGGDRHGRELQIVGTSRSCRPHLPPDWVVIERPRPRHALSYGRVDRYYIEPGTGKQFRSLISVHKYLTEGPSYEKSLMMKKRPAAKQMQIVHYSIRNVSPDFMLPEGWIVEEKPRRNVNYAGIVDRYYIEPETGVRFRSLVSVERYLRGARKIMPEQKAPESRDEFNERNITSDSHSLELIPFGNHSTTLMNQNEVKDPMLDFTTRPAKVKWVLSGPCGNMFNPYMTDSAVPGPVRQKWSEAFISYIQDRS